MTRSAEPLSVVTDAPFVFEVPRVPAFKGDDTKIALPSVAPGNGTGNGWARGIAISTDLDETPRTRFQVAPIYPHEGKAHGMRGEVMVEFVVDEQGRVREPHVVRSSNRIFDEPTLRAVSKWVFEPGRRHGRIVRFRMAVPVIFNLSEE